MKKIILLPLLLVSLLLFNGCKKDDPTEDTTNSNTNNNTNNNNNGGNNTATVYINFKVDGSAVSYTEVSATRSSPNGTQAFTLDGHATGVTNPNVHIFVDSDIIGVTAGLNVGMHDGTASNYFFEYTDANGTLYSSANASSANDEGIDLFVSSVSYTSGGTIQGTFSGSVKNGSTLVNITEGTYKMTFSN